MVFQDPAGALNPRMTIGEILDEVLYVHRHALGMAERQQRERRRKELLDAVGLAQNMAERYPHALSGGQRQRVGIARALAVNPRLLVADEPVSALDVSVQVQILNLLKSVNESLGQACLFIAHDLAVVRYMCARAYVMEKGSIVESGHSETLFTAPQHSYTRKLLDAVPDVQKGLQKRKMSHSGSK
jgi:ABC-type glutathione transport system ATPase component